MHPKYPNLELLEFKARQLLAKDETFMNMLNEKRATNKLVREAYVAHVFPQTWGSTCLGFDTLETGEATIGGCAMTCAYTTVLREMVTDTWIVFFAGEPCYKVIDANEAFLHDLAAQNMASLSEAKKRY